LSNEYHYNITELDFDTSYFAIQETNPGVLAIQLNPTYNIYVSSFNAGDTGLTPDFNSVGSVVLGGVLNALHGGTGFDKYNTGDMLYSDRQDNLSKIPIGQDSQVLTVVNGLPQWKNSNASGTGSQLPDNYQIGDILYANSTSTLLRRTIGTENSVFTVKNGLPVWQTGYVNSISGNVTGIYGNNLQNGNLVLSGTLYANSGGTGISIYSAGDMLMALTPNNLGKLAAGANGSLLSIVNGMPTWIRQATNSAITGNNTGLTTTIQNGNVILTGALYANSGGTGITSYAVGDILYAINSTTLARLAGVPTSGYVLAMVNGLPSWKQSVSVINMANIGFTNTNIGGNVNITGVLNSNSGGTGTSITPVLGQILIGQPGGSYLPGNIVAGDGITVTVNNRQIIINANNAPGAGGSTVVTTINNLIYLDTFGNQTLINYVPNTGGDIQVFGTGYQAGAKLWFGNGNPYSYSSTAKSLTSTTAVFTMPATNPGTYDVTLVNPDGSNAIRPRGVAFAIPGPVTTAYKFSVVAYVNGVQTTWSSANQAQSAIAMQISEGQTATFVFEGSPIADGTSFYYTISGTNIASNRFTDAVSAGTITIQGGTVTFTKTLLANNTTNGVSNMVMTIYSDSARTKSVAISPVITILDTSLSASPPLVTKYNVSPDLVIAVNDTKWSTGSSKEASFTVTGGTAPYTFAIKTVAPDPSIITMTALPPGLSWATITIQGTTWRIVGTPTSALPAPAGQPRGTALYVDVTDKLGQTATVVFYLIINPGTQPLSIVPNGNFNFTVGTPITLTPATASGGDGTSYVYTIARLPTGSAPVGLTLNVNTGELSGTPTTSQATTSYTVTIYNSSSPTVKKTSSPFTIKIDNPPAVGVIAITGQQLYVNLANTPNGKVFGVAKYYTTSNIPSDAWVDMYFNTSWNSGTLSVKWALYKVTSASSYAGATKVQKVGASDQVLSNTYYEGTVISNLAGTNTQQVSAYTTFYMAASATGGVFVPRNAKSYYFIAIYDTTITTPTFNATGATSANTKVTNIIEIDPTAADFYTPR
jgi:hypothetical protein